MDVLISIVASSAVTHRRPLPQNGDSVSDRSGHRQLRAFPFFNARMEVAMNIHLSAGPLIALIAGILILLVPRLLNYIVALYLILVGVLGLFGAGNLRLN